jgi:hypothetical protein
VTHFLHVDGLDEAVGGEVVDESTKHGQVVLDGRCSDELSV